MRRRLKTGSHERRLPLVIATGGIICIIVAAALSLIWVLGDNTVDSEVRTPPPEPTLARECPSQARECVFTPDELGSLAYRPMEIAIAGDGAIHSIRWKTYGGLMAVGTGVLWNGEPVTIRLRARSICAGKSAYMEWAVDREGSGRRREFSAIMSAHTWIDACDPEPDGR